MFNRFLANTKLQLVLIIIIAALLRFYQLGAIPVSLTWDEVAWGYNAYSLSVDGRDEFGKFLPYDSFISFGDYKPPVYAYLTVLPVMFFGLTEFAVRFPSAFFGTLTVLITYFVTKEIFGSSKSSKLIAMLAAIFLAVSPWHIMLSRAAFEANIGTFFIASGVLLFLLAVRKYPYLLILATISFIASMYTFNSARIVAPLLFLSLAIAFFKPLWRHKKASIVSLIVGVVLLLPVATFLISPEAKLRYNEVNIFSDTNIVKTANQEMANDNNVWWSKIIHNRRIANTRAFLTHYFDHFNPSFLFIRGDENPKFSTQDVGQMYLWDFPFIVLGALFLFRKREKYWWILPVWLLIGIIPAATARETPHALRIENTLPTWHIITAYGFVTAISLLKKFRFAFVSTAAAVLFVCVVYYLHGYYIHYPKEYPLQWQDSYKDVITYIKNNEQKYDHVYISTQMERGYIYALFYLQYEPQKFREEAKIRGNDFGFVHVDSFGKYYFENYQEDPSKNTKVLYVSGPENLPNGAKVLKEFFLRNGIKQFVAYTK